MGKQGKSKATSKKEQRPTPYPKKAKVDVTYDDQKKSSKAGDKKGPAAKPAPKPKPKQVTVQAPKKKKEEKEVEIVEEKPKTNKGKQPAAGPSTFIICAGSYEKILYGIEGSYPESEEVAVPELEPAFIFPAHLACVKAVAASPGGKWLATGSVDEYVKVWDLRRRKEVGSLSQHTESITSLHFPTPSHLLTTSADSTLSLFRTSDWTLLKTLKGHSGRVNQVDVHPTGRVALSVGKDKTLKMWDLMRGRGAASLPLGEEAELVKFSDAGTHFAVLFPHRIQIYSLTLKLLKTISTKSRFNTLLFATLPAPSPEEDDTELLCIGTEKGIIEVHRVEIGGDEESDEEDEEEDEKKDEGGKGAELDRVATLVGHTNRQDISSLPFTVPTPSGPRPTVLLSSVSSDGFINLYDLAQTLDKEEDGEENKIEPSAKYDTKGTRLTCVFLADGQEAAKIKKVKEEIVSEDEDESEDEAADFYGSEQGSDEESEDEEEGSMEVEFEDEEEAEEEGEYE
ncbi:protein MAK11 [Cryptococcus wingfieldii CBS 7118]|uniref:Protein MAK11 n=1 Tax=Cryptococcus wingfieldii CBS 7118 TaxID=1295528 RepID=A0A1E3JP65_9TREE|nr:protein MAK11 [Cryptococcus wingfieldii CBS 7118]ODO01927.1 protein MAK11 [Cryptococcus wingfieldii CBS 7118]